MLRDASMMAAAPLPVPPPYETVPSYAMGQTRTREFSKLENSSSAMPPKFIGRDCDSDITVIHRLHRLHRLHRFQKPQLWFRNLCNPRNLWMSLLTARRSS